MDLWQLNVFCKVVELKSFSRAGEAVRLSQPTVSSHIKELENHFNTQLVDRLAKQAVPTKAGALLYSYAQRLLALRAEAQTAMAEFLGEIKGRLCVGGSTIPGAYVFPRLIGGFTQTYPGVRIALWIGDSSQVMAKMAAGEVELGIVGAESPDHQLEQTRLMTEESFLVVPAGHQWAGRSHVNLSELLEQPFIVRESGSGTLRALEKSLQQGGHSLDELRIVAEMGSTEAVRQAIKNGIGLSVLPSLAVEDDVRSGSLKTLAVKGLDLKRSYYLTLHAGRTPSPLARTFTAFVLSRLPQAADRGEPPHSEAPA